MTSVNIIIMAAGPSAPPADLALDDAVVVICADGGCRLARLLGLLPALVVGDLDSLEEEERRWIAANRIPVQQHPATKDKSDLHLALLEALERKPLEIIILGGLGGRPDHMLCNLGLLELCRQAGVRARFSGPQIDLFLARPNEIIRAPRGTIVSLLPMSDVVEGVTLRGMRYPLEDATLRRGDSTGLSNVMEENEAGISLGGGSLLVVVNRGKEEVGTNF